MRRLLIFITLIVILIAVFRLSQLAGDWHYILPNDPGALLYVASFDGPSDDWEQYEGRQSAQVVDGQLTLTQSVDGASIYSAASPYIRDFDITVDVRVRGGVFDGQNNNAYGIIFRQKDRDNYYVFLVSSDGTYRIKRVLDNSSRFLSTWIETPAIDTEIGAVNRLRVIGQGDKFQFFINDQQVRVCIPDDPSALSTFYLGECLEGQLLDTLQDDSISYGRLGVAIELDRSQTEDVIVSFDNVIIYGPAENTIE